MLWMGEESSVAELRSALERLVSGSFGKCARCGRSMSAAYLEKHPTAQKCQACSESAQIVRSRRTPS
jgi:RNA polymerase-binding transcription factor DksA